MSAPGMRRCVIAAGVAAALAIGAAGQGHAAPLFADGTNTLTRTRPASHPVAVRRRGLVARWRGVAPGILPGVPSGGDPYYRVRPLVYPVPPTVVVPPLLVPPLFLPPIVPPPPVVLAPLLDDVEPIYFEPIDFGPCFVASEHTGQFGHLGSCAEAYFRQLINEPD